MSCDQASDAGNVKGDVLSKVRNITRLFLRSEISFSRTCNIPNLISYIYRIALLTLQTLYWLCVYIVAQSHAHWNKHLRSVKFSKRGHWRKGWFPTAHFISRNFVRSLICVERWRSARYVRAYSVQLHLQIYFRLKEPSCCVINSNADAISLVRNLTRTGGRCLVKNYPCQPGFKSKRAAVHMCI